jgi:D-inositol-3-phosphate glycosyltransferase
MPTGHTAEMNSSYANGIDFCTEGENQRPRAMSESEERGGLHTITAAMLTGGVDRPYALGLARQLISKNVGLDFIASDELDCPELRWTPGLNFLHLRGDQRPDVGFARKVSRTCVYYLRLIRYSATARPRIFHILWNNKFEYFDRTLLILYYKALRKKIVLTAHNINTSKRDSRDTLFNRLTLRVQYRLADHIFVHTEKMRSELIIEFKVKSSRVTVIPFGINNEVPNTSLMPDKAKQRLGIRHGERTILFFGKIRPYKGLEYLVTAFLELAKRRGDYQLIVAGMPGKGYEKYWDGIRQQICQCPQEGRALVRANFIPDNEIEVYFKAADVLVLPYRSVYESGVLFLGYNFGLPVLAADVGSVRSEIIEGQTGFVFKPEDASELVRAIERYFASDLYKDLENRRESIRSFAAKRHSWDMVGQITKNVYASLLPTNSTAAARKKDTDQSSLNAKARS